MVAHDLWRKIVADPDAGHLCFHIIVHQRDSNGLPSLVSSQLWLGMLEFCRECIQLKDTLSAWAQKWMDCLLQPSLGNSRSVSPVTRDQDSMRTQLWIRDGFTSVVDDSTSRTHTDFTYLTQAGGRSNLEAAHVMPFSLGQYAESLDLLYMLSGGTITPGAYRDYINNATNAFFYSPNTHDDYDAFCFAIQADESEDQTVYTIQELTDNYGVVKEKADHSTPLPFGRCSYEHLPDPKLCNIRLTIWEILRASGAAEALARFRFDEDDLGQTRVLSDDPNTTSYLEHRLRQLISIRGWIGEEEESEGDGVSSSLD